MGEFVAEVHPRLERGFVAKEAARAAAFDAAVFGSQQAGEETEQTRFAAAVGAFEVEGVAGFDTEGERAEQQAIAAAAGEIGGNQGIGRHARHASAGKSRRKRRM